MSNALVLQSDFGTADGAVSAMYGVAVGVSPELRICDLTHEIPQYDIWEASYRLIQTIAYWPEGTVFVSVVDPGVGSERRSIVVRTKGGRYVVTPDNGTLTHVKRMMGIVEAREIDETVNRLAGSGESYTFRALNRLDKDTSGCVILAKDRIAYSLVQPTVEKEYVAVCEGNIEMSGTIDAPIALCPDSKLKRCVCVDGDRAVTHYEPIAHGNVHTMCRMKLETGRTHQIRCHMSHIGHPLAGDDLYGGSLRYITRQALHCQSVRFTHPDTKEAILLSTEIPTEFLNIIHKEG